ncbi:MAG: DUF3105 domain-containing protein [Geodermatophilaceae bacterium]
MRRVCLPLVLALSGCVTEVAGQAQPAADAAAASYAADGDIPGVTTLASPSAMHSVADVDYPESPPYGGDHDPAWADCTGTIYPEPIRSENAMHSLEHGAVWVTYSPDLAAEDVALLEALVAGVDYTMLSPYADLDAAVSVQSWGRQLKVDSADDPRLDAFVRIYRLNSETTPEIGAPCTNPEFAASPRGPGS